MQWYFGDFLRLVAQLTFQTKCHIIRLIQKQTDDVQIVKSFQKSELIPMMQFVIGFLLGGWVAFVVFAVLKHSRNFLGEKRNDNR